MPDFFRGRFFDPYDESIPKEEFSKFVNSVSIENIENDIFNKLLPKM